MNENAGRAVWRVDNQNATALENAFDALILIDDEAHKGRGGRHVGLPTPYEGELPDVPLTLIVLAHPEVGPLTVRYTGYATDGSVRVVGHGRLPLTVIHRSVRGILITGLPAPPDSFGPAI